MRIISQDKMTDTPYDGAVVYIHRRTNKQIYVGNVGDDEGFLIGTYNSEEDAVYVMSLIQKTSMCNHKYFYMPEVEEVSTIRAKMEEVSRNDLHTAPNQKLESGISRTARLLCTLYSRLDSCDKDSASSAVSERR